MSPKQDRLYRSPPHQSGTKLRSAEVPLDQGASGAGDEARLVAGPGQDLVSESPHEVEETGAMTAVYLRVILICIRNEK